VGDALLPSGEVGLSGRLVENACLRLNDFLSSLDRGDTGLPSLDERCEDVAVGDAGVVGVVSLAPSIPSDRCDRLLNKLLRSPLLPCSGEVCGSSLVLCASLARAGYIVDPPRGAVGFFSSVPSTLRGEGGCDCGCLGSADTPRGDRGRVASAPLLVEGCGFRGSVCGVWSSCDLL